MSLTPLRSSTPFSTPARKVFMFMPPFQNACPLNWGCTVCRQKGPRVAVVQLVTLALPKKCHLQLKQTSNAVEVAVFLFSCFLLHFYFFCILCFLSLLLLLATFWQLHFLTGVQRAPCKWPNTHDSRHPKRHATTPNTLCSHLPPLLQVFCSGHMCEL